MGDGDQAGGRRGRDGGRRSPKLVDMSASTHRVLMNFQLRERWTVHFLEADCKTVLWPGRYYDFESVDRLREILVRAAAPPETFEEFDRCVRSWSRGSVYLDLTEEQYGRLKRGGTGKSVRTAAAAQKRSRDLDGSVCPWRRPAEDPVEVFEAQSSARNAR